MSGIDSRYEPPGFHPTPHDWTESDPKLKAMREELSSLGAKIESAIRQADVDGYISSAARRAALEVIIPRYKESLKNSMAAEMSFDSFRSRNQTERMRQLWKEIGALESRLGPDGIYARQMAPLEGEIASKNRPALEMSDARSRLSVLKRSYEVDEAALAPLKEELLRLRVEEIMRLSGPDLMHDPSLVKQKTGELEAEVSALDERIAALDRELAEMQKQPWLPSDTVKRKREHIEEVKKKRGAVVEKLELCKEWLARLEAESS